MLVVLKVVVKVVYYKTIYNLIIFIFALILPLLKRGLLNVFSNLN
jgi:hypothetical protein